MTKEIKKSIAEIDDKKYAVVDTPGIFDTDEADYENAQDLVKYLKGCGGVNTFIVIGKPPRLDMNFQQMLANLNDMLGKGFWDHVIFVITHVKINTGNDDDGDDIKDEDDDDDEDIGMGDEELPPAEWLKDFAMKVRGKLSLPRKPVVIGVENRNENSYNTAIKDLLERMKKNKFVCDRLKSPFDVDKVRIFYFFCFFSSENICFYVGFYAEKMSKNF